MAPPRRRIRLLLVYAAVTLPAVVYGATAALRSNANSPLDWVTNEFPARRDYEEFCRQFGPGDVVVASWEGCTLDNVKLDAFAAELRNSSRFHSGETWLFDRVASGREAFAVLTAPGFGVTPAEAADRLRGSLVGPDGRTTCVVIGFTTEGLAKRSELVAEVRRCAKATCGVAPADLHLAGPVIDGLSVDDASRRALDELALPSAIVTFAVCCWCLRSLRAACVVFGLSVYCQAVTLALIHWCGEAMSALLIVLPPLIQVLSVAGGIHLANYFFEAVDARRADPAGEAVRAGWLPSVLSSGTTAVGAASLMVSGLSPVRAFGAYSAAGVLLTAGLLLALVPAALSLWPPRPRPVDNGGSAGTGGVWHLLATFLGRHHLAVTIAMLAVAAGIGVSALSAKASVRIETLFPADSRILSDYRWIEKHVAPLVPIEVVLSFDEGCQLDTAERLTLLWRVHRELHSLDGVGAVTSAGTFAPRITLPQGATWADAADRAYDPVRPLWKSLRQLREEDGGERWRVTACVSAVAPLDYGEFLDRARGRVGPLLADTSGRPIPGVAMTATGVMPLVHEIQRRLMSDLFTSFLSALALITAVMTVAQAGFAAGLVAMLPNVFPTLLVFGLLGRRGVPLDIGTVMTASVALGIAVDDTLHYLTFFRRGLGCGLDRPAAVLSAYKHCGPAMAQTSLTCAAGLAVFAFSNFVPTARFAWLMVALIAAALAGDLILLPALLLGPLGRLFDAEIDTAPEIDTPRTRREPPQISTSAHFRPGVRILTGPRRAIWWSAPSLLPHGNRADADLID